MRLGRLACALGLLWAPGPLPTLAQSITGAIVGMVHDPNQAVLPKAAVQATNVTTGAEHSAETDPNGFYRLGNLPPGEYSLEIAAPGFRTAILSAQRVSVGDSLRLDVTLQIGPLAESVQVTAVASSINTEDAQLGRVMLEIPQLPVLSGNTGRNALNLLFTQPGVTAGFFLPGGSFAVNGLRGRMNNFMFDGADSNDAAGNFVESVDVVSPNALAEFRLVTGPRKAEFGRNAGAVVIVTTKSGGNRFHGVASETFRNTKLNAVPFFQKSVAGGTPEQFADGRARKPVFHLNDFDVNLGGPIRKDRTFFFASYLGFRRRQGVVRSATVPSAAERTAIQAGGRPEARALLALVPPATVGNTLFSSPKDSLKRDQGLLKVDHYFSPANRLSASYFIEDRSEFAPFAAGPIPGFGARGSRRNQNLVLQDTHAFSPTLFHDFRAAFHRFANLDGLPENRTRLSTLGLAGIVPDDPGAEGPPNVAITGFASFGSAVGGPGGRADSTFQVLDNLSWTRNRHSIKFGGDARVFRLNALVNLSLNGAISVDGSGTRGNLVPRIPGLSDPLNDFAQGFATSFQQGASARGGSRTRSVNLFFQDDWKASRTLALNFGLRWEYNSGLTEVRDRIGTLRVGQQSAAFPDAPVGLVYAGDAGVPRATHREDYNNFAPRFGFAWDLLRDGRTSLRGGYGLFYDLLNALPGRDNNAPPFRILPVTRSTDYANPWLGSRVNPIPQPFPYEPVQRGDRFDFTGIAPIANLTVIDHILATPYAQQWTLQLQQQLGVDWLLEAGYVGSRGVKLYQQKQVNPAIPGPGATAGNTDRRRLLNQNNPQNARFGGAVFGSILQYHSDAASGYHSMQVNVTKRFSHGFQTTHAYTWAHSIDNASDLGAGQAARIDSARANRGNSSYDVRHTYVITYVYEFPAPQGHRGVLSRVLGGWGIAGVTTFASGIPINISEPDDRCLCNSGGQRPDALGRKPEFYDPRLTSAVPGRPNSWFDGTGGGLPTGAPSPFFRRVGSGVSFADGAGRFGNLGRNVFYGPGRNNWDLAAFKRTRISEAHTLEFRAEFFNLLNHSQFLNPDVNISSPNFGRITGTQDPRLIQLSLRYSF